MERTACYFSFKNREQSSIDAVENRERLDIRLLDRGESPSILQEHDFANPRFPDTFVGGSDFL